MPKWASRLLLPPILSGSLAFGASAQARPPAADSVAILTNVVLVPMDGPAPVAGRAIVIQDGRIRDIVPAADASGLAGARLIDGGGRYLVPGLIDFHVHHDENIDYVNYLANGVTTVIGLGQGDSGDPFRALGDSIRRGLAVGPRVYTTDRAIAVHVRFDDPDDARAYVRGLRERGFDLVKVYNDISQPVFDAVVAEARGVGLPVFGHLPRNIPGEYTLSHGLDVVAHAEEFYFAYFGGPRDQELDTFDGSQLPDLDRAARVIDLMVEHEVALIPNITFTLVALRFWDDEAAALADPEMRYSSPTLREGWRQNSSARRTPIEKRMLRERVKYAFLHEFTRRAHAAGVLLVAGSDAPARGVIPGVSLHSELRELVKTGLSNEEVLATATRNAGALIARTVDPTARVGIIAPGYEADLLLVDGNPLEDIRNLRRIAGVMVDGRWFGESDLERRRAELAARYAP